MQPGRSVTSVRTATNDLNKPPKHGDVGPVISVMKPIDLGDPGISQRLL